MNRIGLLRALAGCGARSSISQQLQRNPTIGRQDKSAASGRARMVGWLEFWGPSAFAPDGASARNVNDFNAATAVGRPIEPIFAR